MVRFSQMWGQTITQAKKERSEPNGEDSSTAAYSNIIHRDSILNALPLCAAEARNRGLLAFTHRRGELPLTDMEAWIFCRGTSGHLLLIQREK